MALHNKAGSSRDTQVKASNCDDTVPLLHLISVTLKFIGDSVLEEINRSTTMPLPAERIRWIMTVPAIWDNAAKQIMFEAAEKAGLTNPAKDNISVALEPGKYFFSSNRHLKIITEAASIYCSLQLKLNLPVETKYILVDSGGGTIDITCHEVLNEGLREILPASGGDWG
jgi:molecular chaperone DnaK (HSP70)